MANTVRNAEASALAAMAPDTDYTKHSIWPGVSIRTRGVGPAAARRSRMPTTWSILVANRFSDVTMPPLGPRLGCVITSRQLAGSQVSMLRSKGACLAAGFRLAMHGGCLHPRRHAFNYSFAKLQATIRSVLG